MTAAETAARRYIQQGDAVVPISFKTKRPIIKGWQKLRLTEDDVPKYSMATSKTSGRFWVTHPGG